MGNVKPSETMLQGTVSDVKKPFLSAYVRLMTTRKAILWLQDAAFHRHTF